MKIGILGNGFVATRLSELFEHAGHDVRVGGRRGHISLEQAAEHGEIVVIAVHYHAVRDVLSPLKHLIAGKIVVDATNPLNDDWSPLLLGQETSGGEEIAKLVPGSSVVKAFNTIFATAMTKDAQDRSGHKITAFVAGGEDRAVATVAELAESAGFAPVTLNSLTTARYLEAMAHLNINLAIAQGGGTDAAFIYHRA